MSFIFHTLEDKVPSSICLKVRRESGILIALSADGEITFLNEVASFFMSKVDGKRSVKLILSEMLHSYDVDSDELKEDLLDLLRSLQWQRLIRLD